MSTIEELEQYQYQLSHIETALLSDPLNSQLVKLRDDLLQVIQLTKSLLQPSLLRPTSSPSSSPPSSSSLAKFVEGDDVIARYYRNGKLYRGTVTSVRTVDALTPQQVQYHVIFHGYRDPEPVSGSDIFPLNLALLEEQQRQSNSNSNSTPATTTSITTVNNTITKNKQFSSSSVATFVPPILPTLSTPTPLGPALTVSTMGMCAAVTLGNNNKSNNNNNNNNNLIMNRSSPSAPSNNNKKDPNIKAAKRAAKDQAIEDQHRSRQQSWQQFAGNVIKKKSVPGVIKSSIFATPDNPLAKVGVTGSGRVTLIYVTKQVLWMHGELLFTVWIYRIPRVYHAVNPPMC